jgi:hypothetical protein
MKKIITSAIAILAFTISFAQEKGDNYLGLSFGTNKTESKFGTNTLENKFNFIGLNYSHFVANNRRLNVGFLTSKNETINPNDNTQLTDNNFFSVNMGYGILFPLLKNFYAEVTPYISYSKANSENRSNNVVLTEVNDKMYNLGVSGGLLWLPFKHFGLSTNLLSIQSSFNKFKILETFNNSTTESTSNGFNFNNSGSLQNQSFTVFYKF